MEKNTSPETQEKIKGNVQKITYRNEQNGYTVAVVRVGRENVTVVGSMPTLNVGETAEFSGEYTIHQVFGKQFCAVSFTQTAPKTSAAILKYLSSGAIRGVGQSTAIKIIERFGNKSLEIIENHPEELASINGISHEKAIAISNQYKSQYDLKDIAVLLAPYAVSTDRCVKIYKTFGGDSAKIIKDNPYILLKYDFGFSFETVEKIAYNFGIMADDEKRLMAGIEYILRANLFNGHTCLPVKKIIPVAVKLLESDYYRIESIVDKMTGSFSLSKAVIDGDVYISIPEYYSSEEYIAARVRAAVSRKPCECVDELEIDYVENKLGIKFDQMQRDAIKLAFSENMMILTGGPGTGKTTALNGIIELFERRDASIILSAPTGRAAKRMTELTGRGAKTIHRLLEAEWIENGKTRFARNERNPLPCDVLIVDESSMIDTLLFDALLRSVKISCKIILVGDADQLPSISAGNLLADLVKSGKVPTVALNKVFRQSNESLIVSNAHAIINNQTPELKRTDNDFFFLERNSTTSVLDTVLELCTGRLSTAYGFDPLKDIQVLCPSRKYETGSLNFNNLLQQALNPNAKNGAHLNYKGLYYYKGDKVMQIRNNYDILWEKANGESGYGVYNGDMGYITDINISAGSITVVFDDKKVLYMADNLSEIEPAYAVTVHKSQGSEFECVIVPLMGIPNQLAYKNLLYTAVTRAKKLFVAVGDSKLFLKMCANHKKTLRYTLLKGFLDG